MDMPVIARNTPNDLKGHHLPQSELSQLYLPTFFRSFYSKPVEEKVPLEIFVLMCTVFPHIRPSLE